MKTALTKKPVSASTFRAHFKFLIASEMDRKKPAKHMQINPDNYAMPVDTMVREINEMGHSCTVNKAGSIVVDVF